MMTEKELNDAFDRGERILNIGLVWIFGFIVGMYTGVWMAQQ